VNRQRPYPLNAIEKRAIPYELLFASEQLGDSEPHNADQGIALILYFCREGFG
jgi:hypothetical protein